MLKDQENIFTLLRSPTNHDASAKTPCLSRVSQPRLSSRLCLTRFSSVRLIWDLDFVRFGHEIYSEAILRPINAMRVREMT